MVLTKNIDIAISVGAETVVIDLLENESGDGCRIAASRTDLSGLKEKVGTEILSWVELMADEADEQEASKNEE